MNHGVPKRQSGASPSRFFFNRQVLPLKQANPPPSPRHAVHAFRSYARGIFSSPRCLTAAFLPPRLRRTRFRTDLPERGFTATPENIPRRSHTTLPHQIAIYRAAPPPHAYAPSSLHAQRCHAAAAAAILLLAASP